MVSNSILFSSCNKRLTDENLVIKIKSERHHLPKIKVRNWEKKAVILVTQQRTRSEWALAYPKLTEEVNNFNWKWTMKQLNIYTGRYSDQISKEECTDQDLIVWISQHFEHLRCIRIMSLKARHKKESVMEYFFFFIGRQLFANKFI